MGWAVPAEGPQPLGVCGPAEHLHWASSDTSGLQAPSVLTAV